MSQRARPACRVLVLACASLWLGGCDPDAAVFVDASIEGAGLTVTQSSLVTTVGGGFQVRLHLGPRASDASEVGLGAFSLTDGTQEITIREPLGATTDPSFPVTVDVDSDVLIDVTLAEEDNQMAVDAIDQLCAPAGVRIVVALDDGLRGATISARSTTILPVGCP